MTRLWIAAVCSETGEWMLQIALPILVYQATGSAASTAAMMIIGLLPAVLLSPLAGVLADRVDRRRLLVLVALGQAVVAAPLLGVGGAGWLCYIVMAGQAGLAALFEPARNALVRDVAGPDGVNSANGMLASGTNVSRLVGAWLGGLLLAAGGSSLVYAGYATVLLVAVVALLKPFAAHQESARQEPRSAERVSAVREWLDGLDLIRRDRRLWVIGTALLLGAVAQGMFLVLFVPFVLDGLGAGAQGVGLLRGVMAVGGFAAGVGVALFGRRVAPRQLIGWGGLVFSAVTALIWNGPLVTTTFAVYIGLFVVAGIPAIVAQSGMMSSFQTAVPPAATGRLMSSMFAAFALGTVIGMLVAGAAGDALGFTVLLNIQAGLYLASGLVVLLVRPGPARVPGNAGVLTAQAS
jgi:predicted MFS family arabinose efflux permease